MNLTRQIFLWCFFVFGSYRVFAGGNVLVKQFLNSKDWNFVENKGQVSASKIKFYGHQGGVYLYCKPGMISFVFTKSEGKKGGQISEATNLPVSNVGVQDIEPLHWKQQQPSNITTSRVDLVLINSNPAAQILASDQQEYYENYYLTNTPECGITNVHTYKTITYKNIYQHIDLILHSREEGMKYEFVVYPGGKVSDIQMEWRGIEGIKKLKDSGIEYDLALGNIEESAPYSFVRVDPSVRPGEPYSDAGLTRSGRTHRSAPYNVASEEIESHFVLKNNRIRFKTRKYDKTKILVIDPTLIWGINFGEGNDYGHGIATDKSGNIYCAGSTGNNIGLATNGAYQTVIGSNQDAYLAKFNTNGKILWATYYGGKYIDLGWAVATDGSGNVYLTGSTTSDSGIATTGAYQTTFAGNGSIPPPYGYNIGDAFLAKFDSAGKRLWGTYYGGEAPDFGYSVATDFFGNVYITGWTESVSGIATNGAFQTSSRNLSSGEYTDAFIAKFNGNGNIEWATYYSGEFDDGASGVAVDISGNVYIIGATESADMATSDAYQISKKNGEDPFLAKFNSQGQLDWATYFGEGGEGAGLGVALDDKGNVYITGDITNGSGVATSGAYQTLCGGGVDAFLAKFDSTGAIKWATYYGGSGDDFGESIAIDRTDNVCITGVTTSISQIATSGAYQVSLAGVSDAFLSRFDSSGILKWATYYRESEDDVGYGVAVDVSESIYITGFSRPIKPNSGIILEYQTYGNDQVAFLAKFNIPDSDLNPDNFSLGFYPNPFYSNATLKYDLFANSNVNIVLYDAIGRQVAVIENKMELAGQYSIDFNATKFPLAPGVYFLVFKSDEGDKTLKIVSY